MHAQSHGRLKDRSLVTGLGVRARLVASVHGVLLRSWGLPGCLWGTLCSQCLHTEGPTGAADPESGRQSRWVGHQSRSEHPNAGIHKWWPPRPGGRCGLQGLGEGGARAWPWGAGPIDWSSGFAGLALSLASRVALCTSQSLWEPRFPVYPTEMPGSLRETNSSFCHLGSNPSVHPTLR